MLLSIVIPCFNSEKTIKRTIESLNLKNLDRKILSQIEIILINDGSQDRTENIIKELILVYNNISISYYKHMNRGVSYSRNKGIMYSTGKFVLFLDSDDKVSPEYLTNVLNNIKNERYFYYTPCLKKSTSNTINVDKYAQNNYLDIENHVYGKFFNRNILLANNLFFPENIKIGEDLYFLFKYMMINNFILKKIDNAYYLYLADNMNSVMNTTNLDTMTNNTFMAIQLLKNDLSSSYQEVEYLAIKNILFRTIPKIVNSYKINFFKVRREMKLVLAIINENFPNWDDNHLFHNSDFLYFESKVGSLGKKILVSLKNNKLILIKIYFICILATIRGGKS